ncbi:transporter substrate-binding domain-containing protein [Kribbella sp. NPDC056345]|uniref:transporter substrate-binding domain-containing protein n=1 Tax=Kribbella sp. NPDC056345 TaxID=3345789 RepID=UPI0035D8245D
MTNVRDDLAPTGVLRASINLGNPVLAQGTPAEPRGVTVDIAREIARRLDVPLELVCFDAARKSFEAMTTGQADICFLAIDPARAGQVAFTAPYLAIEGVFVVPKESALTAVADVDAAGIRIGVKEGSAYDLYLTRTLQAATVVRGDEGVEVFRAEGLEVGAGIRQPVAQWVVEHPEYRLIEQPFMQIQQAVGTTKERHPDTVAYLNTLVQEFASGDITLGES